MAITLLSNDEELATDLGARLRKAYLTLVAVHPKLDGSFGKFLEKTIDDSFIVGMGSLVNHTHSRELAEAWARLRGAFLNSKLTHNEEAYRRLLRTAFLGDFGLRPVWDFILSAVLCGDGTIPEWMTGLPSIGKRRRTTTELSELLSSAITGNIQSAKRLRRLAGWLTIGARPPSASALSLLAGDDFPKWRRVVKGVSGVKPPKPPVDTAERFESPFPSWDAEHLKGVTVATGNIATKDDWFLRAAQGAPVATDARRSSLNKAFDHMSEHGQIDFCVTPELSIPRAFAFDLALLRQIAWLPQSTKREVAADEAGDERALGLS